MRYIKTISGLLVTIGVSFGVAMLEVYLIQIRGTMLAFIVAFTVSFLVIVPGVILSLWWGFANK
jgi:uncharacterized membrane protein YccC